MNTNVAALATQRNLSNATNRLSATFERMSSGKRINRAADDAAGLSISTRMNAQVRGFNQALRNVNDGVSLSQVAQGALKDVQDTLQRMRELAVQAANDTNSTSDRQALNEEFTQLRNHIAQVAATTDFNGTKLLDGTFSGKTFHVSSNGGQTLSPDAVMGVQPSDIGRVTGPGQTVTGTPPGWTSFGNSMYKLTSSGLTCDQAETEAVSEGGHLAAINSSSENIFVQSMFQSLGEANSQSFSHWIGLSDAVSEGNFVWSNGDPKIYVNWQSGEPNNGGGGPSEDYVSMYPDNWLWGTGGKWNDIVNSTPGTGIIEEPLSAVQTVIPGSASDITLADVSLTSQSNAELAISVVDQSVNDVAGMVTTFGAFQNRMDSIANDLMVMSQNTAGARSRIEDADYAAETANLAKNSIVQQAGTAILAQANQQPNIVMQLLK
ncbi:MAG: hypothetical protein HQM06_13680 [Magnetococcales bacterium]|nr:hypothetical protein [Magnetococcales bacterium]